MAVDKEFRAFVCGQLMRIAPVRDRSMFGGVGLYTDERFFGIIDNDTLYLKADDQTRAIFQEAGAHPFAPFGDDTISMSYYSVAGDMLEDVAELRPWVELALEAAARAPAKRPRKKKSQ
jgi:DNA transformation protein